jgi:hypothetical protein
MRCRAHRFPWYLCRYGKVVVKRWSGALQPAKIKKIILELAPLARHLSDAWLMPGRGVGG